MAPPWELLDIVDVTDGPGDWLFVLREPSTTGSGRGSRRDSFVASGCDGDGTVWVQPDFDPRTPKFSGSSLRFTASSLYNLFSGLAEGGTPGNKIVDIWHVVAHGRSYIACCIPGPTDVVVVVRLLRDTSGIDPAWAWRWTGRGGGEDIIPNDVFLMGTEQGVGLGACFRQAGKPTLRWVQLRADLASSLGTGWTDVSTAMNTSGSGRLNALTGLVEIVAPDTYEPEGAADSRSTIQWINLSLGPDGTATAGTQTTLLADPAGYWSYLMPTYISNVEKPLLLVKACHTESEREDDGPIILYVEEEGRLARGFLLSTSGNRPHLSYSEKAKKVYVAFTDTTDGSHRVRLARLSYAELGIRSMTPRLQAGVWGVKPRATAPAPPSPVVQEQGWAPPQTSASPGGRLSPSAEKPQGRRTRTTTTMEEWAWRPPLQRWLGSETPLRRQR